MGLQFRWTLNQNNLRIGNSLDINSQNKKTQNPNFKSQHLATNPSPGPSLKCAPGHESIEDSIIIKSYWLKSGVVQNQNRRFWKIDILDLAQFHMVDGTSIPIIEPQSL